MMTYIRRARNYIATVLLLYTVLVTYFLARTAWDHGISSETSPVKDGRLLDVLVREERRHLQNFHDVVRNFNDGSAQVDIERMSIRKHHLELQGTTNNTFRSNTLQKVSPVPQQHHSKHQNFDVQVEEWDQSLIERRRQEKVHTAGAVASNARVSNAGAANARIPHVGAANTKAPPVRASHSGSVHAGGSIHQKIIVGSMKQTDDEDQLFSIQKVKHNVAVTAPNPKVHNLISLKGQGSIRDQLASYNLSFCKDIDQKENLCKTERYNLSHPDHASISTSTYNFKAIGDIYIYSVYFDPRLKPGHIRMMVLGVKGRNNIKSVYWCVFDEGNDVRHTFKRGSPNIYESGESSFKNSTQATQLDYYAASDGHQKSNQFYIMSCPVPTNMSVKIAESIGRLYIRLVIGTDQNATIDAVQEGLWLHVINAFSDASHRNRLRRHRHGHVARGADKQSKPGDKIVNIKDYNVDNRNSKVITNNNVTDNVDADVSDNDDQSLSSQESIVSCVGPLHGNLAVVQIVEFIELTLLLGSHHIVFYTFQVPDDVRNILEIYRKQGIITVMPWTLRDTISVWANGRDVALNDCLYRTMFHFDWAMFHDIDEFFVPRVTSDLTSFLSYLRKSGGLKRKKHSDLVFSSAYFPPPSKLQFKDLINTAGHPKDVGKFVSLKSVHRSYINQKHTLRIVNGTQAMRVGAGERKKTSYIISTPLASVNHYSYCPRSNVPAKDNDDVDMDKEHNACQHTKIDWVMWRYKNLLIENTKTSLRGLQSNAHVRRRQRR